MKREKTKSITIECTEWFDKINGNSYFSAKVVINQGKEVFYLPFQYGYGNHYIDIATQELNAKGYLRMRKYGCYKKSLYTHCKDNNIFLFTSKKETLKRDMF